MTQYHIPTPEKILPACRVVPVVVLHDIAETAPMLSDLAEGGVLCAEITFRTACAPDAIRLARKAFPQMCVGAGTVINREQAVCAVESGAQFIVSPGLSESVAQVCDEYQIPYLPGCVTPTEIMAALQMGITTVKFFPADVYGGLKAIRALSAPFPQVKFLPTGGVDLTNLSDFLACDKIAAVGGSFICKGNIKENCKKLNAILAERGIV